MNTTARACRRTRVVSIRSRKDFVALRTSPSVATPSFILAARRRDDADPAWRVGYTVTKKIGGAVVRNRIKRRLREAVRAVLPTYARDGVDYVLIARGRAATRNFVDLLDDLKRGLLSLPEAAVARSE